MRKIRSFADFNEIRLDYVNEVRIWYEKLLPRLQRFLYGNGGPIIMVQVENEYGAFACDNKYSIWLRDETKKYVADNAVLFTNDIIRDADLKCGKIEDVLATLDFGVGNEKSIMEKNLNKKYVIFNDSFFTASKSQIETYWKLLRAHQPKGPLVNAEFYPGWFTHWQEAPGKVAPEPVAESLKYFEIVFRSFYTQNSLFHAHFLFVIPGIFWIPEQV